MNRKKSTANACCWVKCFDVSFPASPGGDYEKTEHLDIFGYSLTNQPKFRCPGVDLWWDFCHGLRCCRSDSYILCVAARSLPEIGRGLHDDASYCFFFVIFGATHTYQMPSRVVFKMGAASLLPLSLYISLYVNWYLSHNMRTCIFNVRKADLNQQHVGTETADGQCPYVDPKDPTTSSSTSGTSTVTSTTTSTSATTSTISTASLSITTTGTSATQSTTTSTAFTSTAAATATTATTTTTATTASTSTITETITTATVTTITATGSISSSTSREHGSSSKENLNTTTETMTTSSSLVWLSNQMGQIFKSMKLESLGRSNEWQQLDHHLSFFMQQKARAGFCIDRGRNQT